MVLALDMHTRVTIIRTVEAPVFDHQGWRDSAACRGHTDLFLVGDVQIAPKSGQSKFDKTVIAQSKAICSMCPVIDECLSWALRERIPYFVYGGLSWRERQKLLGLRRNHRTLVDSGFTAVAE